MTKKPHKNRGSSLESFLEEEGVREQFETQAIKEVIAWQLSEAMEKKACRKIAWRR